MAIEVGLTGQLFTLKITNHSTLIVSVVSQINFYLINYLNLYYIIIVKYKILILNYVVAIVYTFSIQSKR